MSRTNPTLTASRLNLARARELMRLAARKRADADLSGAQELEATARALLVSDAPPTPLAASPGVPLLVAVYDAATCDPDRLWTEAKADHDPPTNGWLAVWRPGKGYVALPPEWVNATLFAMGAAPRATIATWKACGWIVPDHTGIASRSTSFWGGRARLVRIRIAAVETLRAEFASRIQSL